MKNECAIGLAEAFNTALQGYPAEAIEKVRKRFVQQFKGNNIYISMKDPLAQIRRNIEIIKTLPRCGKPCNQSQINRLSHIYNLSSSQIYRIRREAVKTYLEIEKLYDYGLIEQQEHNQYIALLKQKLPQEQLGKSLQ